VLVTSDEGKILLVEGFRRGWEFPGGYVDRGESIHAAAKREVKEESGIDIETIKILGLEHYIGRSTTVVILSGKPIGGKLTISNENSDVGYFTFEESKAMMKLKNFQDRLVRCLHETKIPFFIEQ
jgi:8-oxo-dGTP diphosphatase